MCLAVTVGYGWLPTCVAMADECGWFPRVWRWQLGVVGARVCGHDNWVRLVPTSLVMPVGCCLCRRAWRWQLDVVAFGCG